MLYWPGGMPTVFIIAQDWLLRTSIRAELREKGIAALGMKSTEEAAQRLAEGTVPSVLVWEATGEAPPAGLESLAGRVPAVVVASRATPGPVLEHAAAVFYRPVRVGDVVAAVLALLRGEPA
jgi:hypothetical protein